MWPNPKQTADLATFTEEILNGKIYSLCSNWWWKSENEKMSTKFSHPLTTFGAKKKIYPES